jgi:hypothetical protein
LYWEGKQSDSERWIHKSLEEVRAETGLSRYEQDGVRRALERKGILECRYDRLVHRLYFRIDLCRLSDCWEAEYPSAETAENPDPLAKVEKPLSGKQNQNPSFPWPMWKNHFRECGKPAFAKVEKPLSYNRTENTAENTKETTTTTARTHEGTDPTGSQDEKSSSSLSLADELVSEYGLSHKQRKIVTEYCESFGEQYVRSKAEIVQAQPRQNAAGALLAALRDDWQPPVQPNHGAANQQARLGASRTLARQRGWEW